MSSVVISGDTSGAITVSAPAVAGTNTLTLQAATATSAVNTLATAVASTSGTSLDFTGIPSWVKRIPIMFDGVSTSGTSFPQVQIGSGSVTTTGYAANSTSFGVSTLATSSETSGFFLRSNQAASITSGHMVLTLLSGNTWISSSSFKNTTNISCIGAGNITLGGTLDRVRITTVNGTDTFDAGTVNILYEG